jgi:hypothetical protein
VGCALGVFLQLCITYQNIEDKDKETQISSTKYKNRY